MRFHLAIPPLSSSCLFLTQQGRLLIVLAGIGYAESAILQAVRGEPCPPQSTIHPFAFQIRLRRAALGAGHGGSRLHAHDTGPRFCARNQAALLNQKGRVLVAELSRPEIRPIANRARSAPLNQRWGAIAFRLTACFASPFLRNGWHDPDEYGNLPPSPQ